MTKPQYKTNKTTYIIFISLGLLIALYYLWYNSGFNTGKKEDNQLINTVSCSVANKALADNYQIYTKNGEFSVQFPSGSSYLGPKASDTGSTVSIGPRNGFYSGTVMVTGGVNVNYNVNYSVSTYVLTEQPTLEEVEEYFGANKICSRPDSTIQNYKMTDFFTKVSKFQDETFYARYRIILKGTRLYELKMNSDTPDFYGYYDFVNSFKFEN